jgi:hypothetical protein
MQMSKILKTDMVLNQKQVRHVSRQNRHVSTGCIALATYMLSLVMNALLIRYIGIERYGDTMLSYQATSVVSMLLLMGTSNLVRAMFSIKATNGIAHRSYFVRWHLGFIVQSITIYSIGYLVMVCLLVGAESLGCLTLSSLHITVWALVCAPLLAVCQLCRVYLIAFGHRLFSHMTTELCRMGIWTALIGLGLYYVPMPDHWDMVIMIIIQSLILCLFALSFAAFFLSRPLSELVANQSIQVDMKRYRSRHTSIINSLYRQLPTVALLLSTVFFAADETVAGDLSLCITITMIFGMVTQFFTPLAYDELRRYLGRSGQALSSPKRVINLNRVVICSHIGIISLLVTHGHAVLDAFGRDSSSTHWMLIGVGIASIFRSLYEPLHTYVLVGSRCVNSIERFNMSCYLLMLLGGPWAVYYFGVPHLIVGYVLSSFIQLCFSSYLVRKTTGLFLMAVWSSRRAHSTDDNAVMVTG